MNGSSLLSGSGTPVRLSSAASSTVDGNGNSFYGSNAISGFVVDQTAYAAGSGATAGNPVIPSTATETALAGTSNTYGFAQPAVAAAVPTGVGAARTTQALSGNFGGLMYTTAQPSPYVVTGGTIVSTNASANQAQSTLIGNAQTAASGVDTLNMQYGGLTPTSGYSAFVDNSTFAAAGDPTASPQSAGYFVSSGAAGVPAALLQQAGATACQCQYLQWGYWGGDLQMTNSDSPFTRVDRGHINTWVAGVPTPLADLTALNASSASGNYTGHAIGSVFNNGQNYLAAGGFNGTYNFGTQIGSIAITNFDGHTFTSSGRAPLSGSSYTFNLLEANTGIQGGGRGTFYGPMAAETGGNFAVQGTSGPAYLASGIYAGKR
jgi:hypothetical protein